MYQSPPGASRIACSTQVGGSGLGAGFGHFGQPGMFRCCVGVCRQRKDCSTAATHLLVIMVSIVSIVNMVTYRNGGRRRVLPTWALPCLLSALLLIQSLPLAELAQSPRPAKIQLTEDPQSKKLNCNSASTSHFPSEFAPQSLLTTNCTKYEMI
jgi:hypothetical protein